MAARRTNYFLCSTFSFVMILLCASGSEELDNKVYVVYMGSTLSKSYRNSLEAAPSVYLGMLESVHGNNEEAKKSLKVSYGKSFHVFAAMLSPSHVQKLSGIWPESESFTDKGLAPVPLKWRGGCNITSNFPACNRKLVGTKFYRSNNLKLYAGEYLFPRDEDGHGTHTSSTVAGHFFKNASLAQGESRGGVPGARVAMYKVCWGNCDDADFLAAFDDAIYDASSIDQQMDTQILLGNKISIMGIAINAYTMEKQWYPLVHGGDVANVSGGFTSANSSYCQYNSLDHKNVKEKIVICNITYPGDPVIVNTILWITKM
ncbi:subtilisin-like protease SBT4.14 [Cryptomeria japonica]|uniref:subtilisin-like protease SBT4.14 n=1 Tax=Cryptomeria japonica TaxID=3369 RepID=UPI0027DA7618|nr:subtilisin-like protease SBT4.14 [Cryptomeria japonica]